MTVLREYNPYEASLATQPTAAPLFNTDINQSVAGGNTILQGSTLRTSNFAGRTATVKPGENINAAIGTLKSAGGGVLFLQAGTYNLTENIVGASKISIIGEGQDQTILDFGNNSCGITYTGTNSVPLISFSIEDLTVKRSGATAAIDIDYSDYWSITNVRVTEGGANGIRVQHSQNFTLETTRTDSNTQSGILINAPSSAERQINNFVLTNCLSDSNSDSGFELVVEVVSAAHSLRRGSFINCTAHSNTDDGFTFSDPNAGSYGFPKPFITLIACNAYNNTSTYGFNSAYLGDVYLACGCPQALTANTFNFSAGLGNIAIAADASTFSSMTGSDNLHPVFGTAGEHTRHLYMSNGSGGSLGPGTVVVYKSGTTADSTVTTTTSLGDDLVCGMVVGTISNNSNGPILVEGKTTLLKVDGTTDIAAGDFLTTFTTAGIACKASAGDMAFAIALEAYTTNDSNGVIDALLIKPRKI